MRKYLVALLLVSALSGLGPKVAAHAAEASQYFAATGHSVQGEFLDFFNSHGGVDIFGYPRTEPFLENGRTVQYFQRFRLEAWPENPTPYRVQLGLLASQLGENQPATGAAATGGLYFPETGHTISPRFATFWSRWDGLTMFGYPIGEETVFQGYTVQFFQRARLEDHPENPEAYRVQLGLLGDEYIASDNRVPAALLTPVKDPDQATPTSNSQLIPASTSALPGNSGGRIAFQTGNGGDIYVMNDDGSDPRVVAQGMDPALSPDGTKVAYAKWGDLSGIYVVSVDGGVPQRLATMEKPQAPVWSADGRKIAFFQWYQGFKYVRQRGGLAKIPDDQYKLGMIDLNSGAVTDLPSTLYSFTPSYSPDGKTIVLKDENGLALLNEAGTITTIPTTDERYVTPAWSPDGTKIVFMWRQHDHWEIGLINSDGGGFHLLTQSPPFQTAANNVAPAWSPDGTKIVFLSDRDGKWLLYAMKADGSNQQRIANVPIIYDTSYSRVASWSNAIRP